MNDLSKCYYVTKTDENKYNTIQYNCDLLNEDVTTWNYFSCITKILGGQKSLGNTDIEHCLDYGEADRDCVSQCR
jgi:hypothetical protein